MENPLLKPLMKYMLGIIPKLHTVQLAVPGIIILIILVQLYLKYVLRYNKNIIIICVRKRSELY